MCLIFVNHIVHPILVFVLFFYKKKILFFNNHSALEKSDVYNQLQFFTCTLKAALLPASSSLSSSFHNLHVTYIFFLFILHAKDHLQVARSPCYHNYLHVTHKFFLLFVLYSLYYFLQEKKNPLSFRLGNNDTTLNFQWIFFSYFDLVNC